MTAHDIVGGVVWGHMMVLMAALIYAVFELCYALTGQRRHFQTRRRVGYSVCASVLLLPLVLPLIMATPYAVPINATDAVVAQYLKGNISISAIEMNSIVEFRSSWVKDIASGQSLIGQAILAIFLAAMVMRIGYLALNYNRIRRAIAGGYRGVWNQCAVFDTGALAALCSFTKGNDERPSCGFYGARS
jgi:ABC-type multidrug transport system permease subunit